MGREDIYESDYLEDPEIFADLVNGVLYRGEQVVKPGELTEQDGELRSVSEKDVKKVIRDKVKFWKGTMLAVFVVENQTKVDYHMVLRVMLAESMAYDRQWRKMQAKNKRENLPPDEFLSGMKKEDRFIPVITIVIYYGREKPWDGAKTLYELLDVKGNEERILPFVSDHKLNMFDFHECDNFEQFHSELGLVFEFLRYSDDKRKLGERLEKKQEKYRKLSRQAKILLARITNIRKIPDISEEKFRKGDFDMCKAFLDMKLEGVEEGRKEGRKEGCLEGRSRYLIEIVCKKLLKNKEPSVIAEELEEELSAVETVVRIQRRLGTYDIQKIYEAMQAENSAAG